MARGGGARGGGGGGGGGGAAKQAAAEAVARRQAAARAGSSREGARKPLSRADRNRLQEYGTLGNILDDDDADRYGTSPGRGGAGVGPRAESNYLFCGVDCRCSVGANRIVRVIDETGDSEPRRKRAVRNWPDADADKAVAGTAAPSSKKPAERPEDWNRPSPLNKLLTLLKTGQKAEPMAAGPRTAAATPKAQKAKHKAAGDKARAEVRAAAYSSDDGGPDDDTDRSENEDRRPGRTRPARGELDAVDADAENADVDGELSDGGQGSDDDDDDPENPQRQAGTPC